MKPRVQAIVVIWASLILAGGTVLLCPTSDGPGAGPESRPPLARMANVFMLFGAAPQLSAPADLRPYVLPVGLAGLLLVAAWAIWPRELEGQEPQPPKSTSGSGGGSARRYTFEYLGAATIAIAAGSALVNKSWELSSWWVLTLACGVGWAALLSMLLERRSMTWVLAGGMAVAAIGMIATFWHRSLLGIQYVRWPIGPITLTAAVGVIWIIIGAGLVFPLIASRRLPRPADTKGPAAGNLGMAVVGAVGALLAVALTVISNRRAAWLGLAAGIAAVVLLVLLLKWTDRRRRGALLAFVCVGASITGGWVAMQAKAPDKLVSGPLKVRFTYWNAIFKELPHHLPLGIGPDMFVCDMTSRLAREKSEHPHVLHGNLCLSAHNEWLQAIYELGLVGGLLYLAMPVWIIIAASRRFLTEPSIPLRAVLLTGAAALTAIVINEAASINLRNPILPVWYWTLIGVTLAAIRRGDARTQAWPAWAPRAQVRALIAGALGVALLLVVTDDLRLAAEQAKAEQMLDSDPKKAGEILEIAQHRRGAANWLRTRYDLGIARTNFAQKIGEIPADDEKHRKSLDDLTRETANSAVGAWSEVITRCPGYPEAIGRLAYALVLAGGSEEAADVLTQYLHLQDRYDPAANMLLIEIRRKQGRLEPERQIRGVIRSLRAGALDAKIEAGLAGFDWSTPLGQTWHGIAASAKAELLDSKKTEWSDVLAPEVMRLEAWRLAQRKEWTAAAEAQRIAAETYERLDQQNSPVRRASPAEVDAWYRAADYQLQADPAQYRQAYQMILKAEHYAVLGMEHEKVRERKPEEQAFVNGESLMEPPGRFRSMWRLSAMLHIAVGSSDSGTRIAYSLPPLAPIEANIEAAQALISTTQATLALSVVKLFTDVPPAQRPPHYDQLVEFTRQFQAATQGVETGMAPASQPASRPAE